MVQIKRLKRNDLNQEELLADTLSCKITNIGKAGKSYVKRAPGAAEGYIYRLDLYDSEHGKWYHSQWYDKSGEPIRTEYYED